ncbi:MAG: hypothetical protein JSW40_06030 [Candidatus Omnitrophota bacterium]|nr:MAG: hypothetical protein JSW40_06030 [Candidatus Omnitrophota bacterium]
MEIVSAVIPTLIIVVVFFFIVRVATVILKLTGLDEKTARFQAVSAFTGTGFTTKEAETILTDDMRRRTVTVLMIMGKVGIISVVGSLFFSFGKGTLETDFEKALILFLIIYVFYKITTLKRLNRAFNRFIEKRIIARGIIKQKTLEELFHLPKGYGIAQLTITKDSEEKGLTLKEAGFIDKDILVLSIERKDQLVPFPHADDVIQESDRLLCYGLLKSIESYA